MTKEDFCVFMMTWIEKFITEYVFSKNYMKQKWIIDFNDIEPVDLVPDKYMILLDKEPIYDTMRGGSMFLHENKHIDLIE